MRAPEDPSSSSQEHDGAAREPAAPETLDPFLGPIRNTALKVMRVAGTVLAGLSAAILAAQLMGFEPRDGRGELVVLVVGTSFGVLAWSIPLRMQRTAGGLLIAMMSLIALSGLCFIGPSMPVGTLLVDVPLLAMFFFGRRAGIPATAAVALALTAVGVGNWVAGRPEIGRVPGAILPYSVYVELAVISLGNVAMAVAAVYATLGAVALALRRAQESAARERAEQERRAAAERSLAQAKRLEAIGHLASGLAHDTRNALVVMSAGLRDLRTRLRSREDEEVLADLEHAASGLTDTMQQLLALGRRSVSAARPVALSAVLGPFTSALRRVIPPEVDLRLEGGSDALVQVDPARVEQALLNLALNARDAMPGGGVLTLRLRDEDREGVPCTSVEVEDDGTGMDPPTAARIFEPFFTTKAIGAGTGLGLSTVREVAAEAGGTVEVDTAVGRGTRVRLVFPVASAAGTVPAASNA